MNRNYNYLIFIVFFLILANVLLFYSILGPSVIIYASILLSIIILIIACFYFLGRKPYAYPPFVTKQEKSLEQDTEIRNLRSDAFKILRKNNFSLHKTIILIEVIIIILLSLNLIIKISL